MAKKKRVRARAQQQAQRTAAPRAPRADEVVRTWKWLTFPVFFAFVSGLLIASVANGEPETPFSAALQIVALLGVGYGVAHLFMRNIIIAGRIRRRQIEIARGIEPKGDFEDEVVYPEESRRA